MTSAVVMILALLAAPAAEDVTELLPPEGVPQEWSKDGGPQLFEGDALFSHINGGAELYRRHGFQRLAVQDYLKLEMVVRVEIFDMGSAEGARAVFDENTVGLDTSDDLGSGASFDPLQIIFHRGRFYVSVSRFDESEESRQAMAALAMAVDDAIQQKGD